MSDIPVSRPFYYVRIHGGPHEPVVRHSTLASAMAEAEKLMQERHAGNGKVTILQSLCRAIYKDGTGKWLDHTPKS